MLPATTESEGLKLNLSHCGSIRVADDLPEFFWSDGNSCEGTPHAPKAKTANSKANKRCMIISLIGERTELGPFAKSANSQCGRPAAIDLCRHVFSMQSLAGTIQR